MKRLLTSFLVFTLSISVSNAANPLSRKVLPPLSNESGVAGPFAGMHNGGVYVNSVRRQEGSDSNSVEFLKDVWEDTPAKHQ